ncbi:MAG: haloalkane dehalogenase [Pseudomonadota bacterium]
MPLTRRTLLTSSAALSVLAASRPIQADDHVPLNGPYGLPISAKFPFQKARADVLDSQIAYVDEGEGSPVLFLHGNPTSSYLWRNIIPYVTAAGYRAIAPDLIGMGDSGKPEIGYSYADHASYLDGFLAALDLTDVTLVVHDWGSALGMRWARLNPDRVAHLAFMEAIVPPGMPVPSYEAMGPEVGNMFRALRMPGQGEEMVLQGNFFIEEILPKFGIRRPLSEAEMTAYRAPFPTPESRRPTLAWPRQIPIGGVPADVTDEVLANGDWLTGSDIPKLLFFAEPGVLMPMPVVAWMAENVPALETRFLGAGLHFLQEDHPHLIGQGLVDWLRRATA